MNLTAWVDVGIGMSVVYLGASLFVTIINEYVVHLANLRGRHLANALQTLIDDDELKKELKKIPVFATLLDGEPGKAPSYVDPQVFTQALLGVLTLDEKITNARERCVTAIKALPESTLRQQLLGVASSVSDSAEGLSKGIGEWLDKSLTMLGESYKRSIQIISIVIGLLVAGALNIDTIALTSRLYQDKDARDAAALVGEQVAQNTSKEQFDKCLKLEASARKDDPDCKALLGVVEAVQTRNTSLGLLPIGWEHADTHWDPKLWGFRVLGWILTALALSLGAPFWFDFLNRFTSMRHGMPKPEPEPEPKKT